VTAARQLVHEHIELDGDQLLCRNCGHVLTDAQSNYRLYTVQTDLPLAALGRRYQGLTGTLDEEIVFRIYSCPSCDKRIDAEVCPRSAAPLHDLELIRGRVEATATPSGSSSDDATQKVT
jgi:acetone carboxylase gamma subunit